MIDWESYGREAPLSVSYSDEEKAAAQQAIAALGSGVLVVGASTRLVSDTGAVQYSGLSALSTEGRAVFGEEGLQVLAQRVTTLEQMVQEIAQVAGVGLAFGYIGLRRR